MNKAHEFYSVKREGIRFWALTRSQYQGRYFTDIKKARDIERIEKDKIMIAATDCIAHFAKKWGIDMITTPPDSGNGISFAGFIAKQISTKADIDFVKIFKNHTKGKRTYTAVKFRDRVDPVIEKSINKANILIFDDIAQTGFTMIDSISALIKKNECRGMVLYVG